MDDYISKLSKAAFFQLRRIAQLLSRKDAESLVHAFITTRLDYCNALFSGLPAHSIFHLQYIQNSAARLLKSAHITPILFNFTGCLYLFLCNTKFFCSPLRHSKVLLLPIFPTYSLLILLLAHSGLLVQNFFVCLGSAYLQWHPNFGIRFPWHSEQSKLKTYLFNQHYH